MSITGWEWFGIGLLVFTVAVIADIFWIERFYIQTKKFYIGPATSAGNNIKIVQLSDLHLQSLNYPLIQLAKKLNKLKPDLIVITGDAIDRAHKQAVLNDFLDLIDNNIQKAAIPGNWEYQGKVDFNELRTMYASHNCTLLINQTVQYHFNDKTVSITGMDDYLKGKPDFEAAVKDYRRSDYHILLSHCPKYSDKLPASADHFNINFILAGHTHGGQITFFGSVRYTPRGSGPYVKGWYKDRTPPLYVSKGIGTVTIPVRFGAMPEIAVFNLPAS